MRKRADWGVYRGKRMSPDSIKKTVKFQGMQIHVDRPKGFVQHGQSQDGKPWTRTYLYDYGFIPKTMGGDQDGLDCFLGPKPEEDEAHWITVNKPDGTFDEYKVMLGFGSREDAMTAAKAHIPEKFLGPMVTMRTSMMRAMLGLEVLPEGTKKEAFHAGFGLELAKHAGLVAQTVQAVTLPRRQDAYRKQRMREQLQAARREYGDE